MPEGEVPSDKSSLLDDIRVKPPLMLVGKSRVVNSVVLTREGSRPEYCRPLLLRI